MSNQRVEIDLAKFAFSYGYIRACSTRCAKGQRESRPLFRNFGGEYSVWKSWPRL